jgi:cobalt/nickel transport protein
VRRALLFGVVVALTVLLLATFASGLPGTDQQAAAAVEERAPTYDPWISPVWTPPGSLGESLLFAAQGGLGAVLLGYYLTRLREMDDARDA